MENKPIEWHEYMETVMNPPTTINLEKSTREVDAEELKWLLSRNLLERVCPENSLDNIIKKNKEIDKEQYALLVKKDKIYAAIDKERKITEALAQQLADAQFLKPALAENRQNESISL